MPNVLQRLHPGVQRWVSRQGWRELKSIQAQAFARLLDSEDHLVVAAATAEGKTEAAWLPIFSALASRRASSVQALYISPLKALINDQWRRFESLSRELDIPVQRWHGDVSSHQKKAFRENPRGVLLITPESLESNFINYGRLIPTLYRALAFVVIDEIHGFLDDVRGIHLRSLLSRLAVMIGRTPRLIGLSATLADPDAAKRFLCPDNPGSVSLVEGPRGRRRVQIRVKGFVEPAAEEKSETDLDVISQVAEYVEPRCRDSSNLVFSNNRQTVENLADRLAQMAKELPASGDTFLVHHGSLDRDVRERAEQQLKEGRSITVLCTSSLELGIDIGSVRSVIQVEAPWTVSSLLQRLGRSGRRNGASAILHLLTRDQNWKNTISSRLYPEFLRGVALVELMLERWLEPPNPENLHLSTLVHQILSVLKQTGGTTAANVHQTLCIEGPFRQVTSSLFAQVLRDIAQHDLIQQISGGDLILGLAGEAIVNAPDFYAAFYAPQDFKVQHRGCVIGSIPNGSRPNSIPDTGECFVLNGRRWIVEHTDWKTHVIEVSPSPIGDARSFAGAGGDIHNRVYQRMFQLLSSSKAPVYLDQESQQLLDSARTLARQLGVTQQHTLSMGSRILWFPWVGTRAQLTLALLAKKDAIQVEKEALCLAYKASREEFRLHLKRIVKEPAGAVELASLLKDKARDRFDRYLSESLLNQANAARTLDLEAARSAAAEALREIDELALNKISRVAESDPLPAVDSVATPKAGGGFAGNAAVLPDPPFPPQSPAGNVAFELN